jgi:UPF0042 nucleotide-binding protein
MQIVVLSFGFKFGVPSNTDLVFDVRFLPNPHFEPELRPLTGQDPRVVGYVLDEPMSKRFLARLLEFLTMLLPLYEKEGKSYLTVSVGCTGGKHRSVVTAEAVEKHFRQLGYSVACHHRDMAKHS